MTRPDGSMETLSALQATADTRGLDAQSKAVLYSPEVLAVILQETVSEYRGFSAREIMDFIEKDSFSESAEVSPGRTNTRLRADSPEFVQLGEKTSFFDLAFRAKNPLLSTSRVLVNLHIDLEPQKDYRPGYPIEKRGIYYLARRLSSQLPLATGSSGYGSLEKCCSIWICRDRVPVKERYSVSFYGFENTRNLGPCSVRRQDFDLFSLVIIRLGSSSYDGSPDDSGYRLLRFLNALMYPHRRDFMDTVSDYIDFSANTELWKEAVRMSGLGESILEEGIEIGRRSGIEIGRRSGIEIGRRSGIEIGHKSGLEDAMRSLVQFDLKDSIPADSIISKLQNYFGLSRESAEQYFRKFAE